MFALLLDQLISHGSLTLITASGEQRHFGDGSGPSVTMRLHSKSIDWQLAYNPYLKLGEAYMDGLLTIDAPHRIYDALDIILSNVGIGWAHPLARMIGRIRRAKRRIDQFNPVSRARANVAHHYDLDMELYDLFLDEDRQYSVAISKPQKLAWRQHSSPRKSTSWQSCKLNPACAFWILAVAGVVWRCIWRNRQVPM